MPASDDRLAWLSERADELGYSGSVPAVLEGKTHADCLITCERAVIWIEGKRHDWLSPRTKWDPQRDQLARNVEAAWIYGREHDGAEYCVLVCHEVDLRAEEQALVGGYRSGELSAGWAHIDDDDVRRDFGRRFGTLTWSEIVAEWPEMRSTRDSNEDVPLAVEFRRRPGNVILSRGYPVSRPFPES